MGSDTLVLDDRRERPLKFGQRGKDEDSEEPRNAKPAIERASSEACGREISIN
jgi:hypothetical protein